MRDDKQKLTSQKKEGAKNQQKDLGSGRQPKAASKQGRAKKTTTAVTPVRRQDEKTGHTLH
jgi:hypothetical protein